MEMNNFNHYQAFMVYNQPYNILVSQVQKQFQIDLNQMSYEQIQLSTQKMREMMKKFSKILDDKIHKYYGLMGIKQQTQQKNKQLKIQQLTKQIQTSNKLISAQIKQIKEIEELDRQMASSKRVQKQAERLRQYFQTKKAMIQAEKQTKYSKGQVNKFGQYLARDLDIDKQYFRLNKIKQDLEYAILKQNELLKKQRNLEAKRIEFDQKHHQMNEKYERLILEAGEKKLILSDNKQVYQTFVKKKVLLQKSNQLKAKLDILRYSNQGSIHNLSNQIEQLRIVKSQKESKIFTIQNQIISLTNQNNSMLQKMNDSKLSKKIDLNMSIKNIDVLLKNKKQKNSQIFKRKEEKRLNESQIFTSQEYLTQSKVFSKPNFKIKSILVNNRNKSKNYLGKSLDLSNKINQNQSTEKRLLKWRRDQKKVRNFDPMTHGDKIESNNPQKDFFRIKYDIKMKQ